MIYEIIDLQILESICDVIGNTDQGLTGSQIGQLLLQTKIDDIEPGITKRKRLFQALKNKQDLDKCSNNILNFIQVVMKPSRYINKEDYYNYFKNELNKILSFKGMGINNEGIIEKVKKSKSLNDIEIRCKNLRDKLIKRNAHPDVFKYCKSELIVDNYFHAVLEATKSVADKIREKAKIDGDGNALVDKVFSINSPILAINKLETETERSEQKGFANLLKGFFGIFRNPLAHEPKIKWEINEADALDLFSLASYIHRKLDQSINIKRFSV